MAVFRQATGAYAPFRTRIYWAFHASESQTAVMEASTGTYAPFRTQKWPDCCHFWRKIGTPEARLQLMHHALFLGIEMTASRPSSTPPNRASRQPFPRGELDVLTPLPIGDSDAV